MKSKIAFGICAAAFLSFIALSLFKSKAAPKPAEAAPGTVEAKTVPVPVVVELFTSEGCASCPPADELLSKLVQDPSVSGVKVIALSEHVDYWNHLGWKDPFSSELFSRRQSDYSKAFDEEDIFTPQMIVDGTAHFVGSNASEAQKAIEEAAGNAKADMTITVNSQGSTSAKIRVEAALPSRVSAGDAAEVLLAITESGLNSNVSRGENSGRRLVHTAVTRKLINLGRIQSGGFATERTLEFERNWAPDQLAAVAFIQEHSSRRILGAASTKISAASERP